MMCPFKLSATLEEVALWAKLPCCLADYRGHAWGRDEFPIVVMDDSDLPRIVPMFPGGGLDDLHFQQIIPAELLTRTPTIWEAFCRRRCLIPVSALVTQRKEPNGLERSFELSPASGSLFALAGVWERVTVAEGNSRHLFWSVTVHPSPLMGECLSEVPVVVPNSDLQRWLTIRQDKSLPIDLLRPLRAVDLKRWTMRPAGDA